jgi:hypothetical protein
MNLTTFKDLKAGDQVRFENVDSLNEKISGEGIVYGFGQFAFTDLVWVTMENGYTVAVPYEEIQKI